MLLYCFEFLLLVINLLMLIKLLFVGLSCGLASVSLLIPYSLPPKCGVHFPTILLGLDEKDRDVKR